MFASIFLISAGALTSVGAGHGSVFTGTPDLIAIWHGESAPLVAKEVIEKRPRFRFSVSQGPSAASEKSRAIEWMDAGNWRMTAGYASTRPTHLLDHFDAAFGNRSGDVRSAKGLCLAAELLSSGGVNSRGTLAFDARLQHVRVQDSSLTHGGEKLGDARLAIVFRHSW